MEPQFKLDNNGQQVQQGDFNTLGRVSALSGDVALQEVLCLTPALSALGTVRKAIVPIWNGRGTTLPGMPGLAIGNGGTGKIRIYPFLAVVGSRNDAATNLQAWKDIRSQVFTTETSLGALYTDYAIASNASGNPRWDLVYVTMSVDTDDATETRYVKPPTSSVATATAVAVTKSTKLTLNTVQGTPGASPAKPSLPADSGSNYNIPLVYVRVLNGFTGTTAVSIDDIQEAPSVVALSDRPGVATCAPASGTYDPALPMLATRSPWAASGNRPRAYMPPSMQGKVERIVPIDLSAVPVSAADGDIVDDTIDWRHRVFKWTMQMRSSRDLAWANIATTSFVVPNAGNDTNTFVGMGQSFTIDNSGIIARGSIVTSLGGTSTSFSNNTTTDLGSTDMFGLYVDQDTGELKVLISGVSGRVFVVWLEASGQYYNATYV